MAQEFLFHQLLTNTEANDISFCIMLRMVSCLCSSGNFYYMQTQSMVNGISNFHHFKEYKPSIYFRLSEWFSLSVHQSEDGSKYSNSIPFPFLDGKLSKTGRWTLDLYPTQY